MTTYGELLFLAYLSHDLEIVISRLEHILCCTTRHLHALVHCESGQGRSRNCTARSMNENCNKHGREGDKSQVVAMEESLDEMQR